MPALLWVGLWGSLFYSGRGTPGSMGLLEKYACFCKFLLSSTSPAALLICYDQAEHAAIIIRLSVTKIFNKIIIRLVE